MKDRQPTQVLANGAIRYGVYNADGTLDRYEYLKREDAPTVEGTPLNKANLLSDATAQKIWPDAETRPEDPTVNDAFSKLAQGTAKVGDIEISTRTDRSNAWLPCDGRYISEVQYPDLFDTLRVSASAAPWSAELLPTGSNGDKEESSISYANGYWFYCKKRHLYYSTDLVSWTDITPSDLNRYDSEIQLLSVLSMHYWQGRYVGLAHLYIGNNDYAYVALYTEQLQQAGWKISQITTQHRFGVSYRDYVRRLFFDGTYYHFFWVYDWYNTNTQNWIEVDMLHSASVLAESAATTWTSDNWTDNDRYVDFYDEATGWYYISRRYSPYTKIATVYKTQSLQNSVSSWMVVSIPHTSASGSPELDSYTVSGNTIVAKYMTSVAPGTVTLYRSDDGGNTFEQMYSGASDDDHASNLQLVAGILCAWDSGIITLFDADGITVQTVTPSSPLAERRACHESTIAILSSNDAYVLHQDFAHSKKKIPSITPDSRSKAYIKALEE